MFSLFKKELSTFLCSLTGFLVVTVFLIASGIFLWVVPSELNIIYGGYATLEPLFGIAPWIYLFLVPAISMRLVAEERRLGTLELLLIRPISPLQIVLAKYLAGLTLVAISIIPTFVYIFIVWQLGEPVGNLDLAATLGSYIGLLLLAALYMAIGIFTSSLTDNQIVAFVSSVAMCFVFYAGFDSVASIPDLKSVGSIISELSIAQHYDSMARGVVDSRDVVYFLSFAALFIALTSFAVQRSHVSWKKIALVPVAVILLNLGAQHLFFRADMTSEGRFTLSRITRSYLEDMEKEIFVRFYLDGDLNPGFTRLGKATSEMLDEFQQYAHNGLIYNRVQPSSMSKGDADKLANELAEVGLAGVPVFETKEDGQKTRTIVYPYAKVHVGDRFTWVNLLENVPGLSADENLNRSIEDIEYKLIDAIRRISETEKTRIAFLEGHGELDELDVVEATDELSMSFAVDRGKIGTDASILDPYKVVIIAKPADKFTEPEKFVLDQYVMRGGRLLWLVDAVNMTLDTLRNAPQTVGLYSDFNIEDMLFVYGYRVNPEVVEDINCGMVPISVQQPGEGSKIVPMPWLFSPLLSTNLEHPVTRNVSLVKGDFTSYIDTVGSDLDLVRTPLLRTSSYTKVDRTPVFASLANIHEKPVQSEFNRSHLNVAVLSEGSFPSVFAHRSVPRQLSNTQPIVASSVPTKMIVVADGDIIRNDVRFRTSQNPKIVPLGYDELTRQTFGNKDFIVNAVQYLADDEGWMSLRNRTFTIRLLNRQEIGNGTLFYKVLAVVMPVVLMALLFGVVAIVRRRKYSC
ncbi:MAG: gliding motility-associated ABC transporter substrate-binding protein GldG [Bacteroidales bacterium]|nr:gliding motility-associated ABC transporter substrate-binding protein GldG [Bacteroidales bacterium]